MILITFIECKPGQILYNMSIHRWGPNKETITQPIRIVREATEQEYRDFYAEQGLSLPDGPPPEGARFYEFTTD